MNFDLTDEQQMLQGAAREFLASRLKSEQLREASASPTMPSTRASGTRCPSSTGPACWSPRTTAARDSAPSTWPCCSSSSATRSLRGRSSRPRWPRSSSRAAATEEQRERYLAPLATGEQRGTLALWDRGAGWTPDDISLEPESSNGGYTLNGEKLFVLDAARADFLIVGATGGRRFIVERDADGVSIVPTPTIDGDAQAVRGQARRREGRGGRGVRRRRRARPRSGTRVHRARRRSWSGVAQRAIEMAVEYAKDRKQFGRAIGSYQAVSHKCAQMLLETEGARSAAYYAGLGRGQRAGDRADRVLDGEGLLLRRGERVTGASLQVHGGIGFTWEHDLHLWLKRAAATPSSSATRAGTASAWRISAGCRRRPEAGSPQSQSGSRQSRGLALSR